MRILLLVGVLLTSGLEVWRGTICCSHGEADFISDFALVKIDVKLIRENEEHLGRLRNMLGQLAGCVSDEQTLSTINELATEIRDKLSSRIPKIMHDKGKRVRHSLLPFMGMAFKSLFGVSTEGDLDNLDDRVIQIERWAEKQSATFITVIHPVNANLMDIKTMADYVNELSHDVNNKTLSLTQR